MTQQHHESAFEVEICEYLNAHGWLYSPTDTGYDRELALFPEDVFGWLSDTQPEQLAKRVKPDLAGQARTKAERGVLATLARALDADLKANGGTLAVLRRGFKDLNAQFQMGQFRPNTSLNETTKKRYDAVRLRVMRQVHYSAQKPSESKARRRWAAEKAGPVPHIERGLLEQFEDCDEVALTPMVAV